MLTAQDYIDIQQLASRYAFAIDTCTNGGADFADLFVDDGEFSVSQEWGAAGKRPVKGRAALIEAAGGDGKGGCKDPKTQMGYGISHIVANHVITPSPQGRPASRTCWRLASAEIPRRSSARAATRTST